MVGSNLVWHSGAVFLSFWLTPLIHSFNMDESSQSDTATCDSESCVIHGKSKEKLKRLISCASPGCSMQFHVACVGRAKLSDKELKSLFFICLRCETFLKYGADIAREGFIRELDQKLEILKQSLNETIDRKIQEECTRLEAHTDSLIESLSIRVDEKFEEVRAQFTTSNDFVQSTLASNKNAILATQSDLHALKDKCESEVSILKQQCKVLENQLTSLESGKRKESYIIRNFPENGESRSHKGNPSNCIEAVSSVANALGLTNEIRNVQDAFRLGKPRSDGKPRLILVRAPERTCSLFLRKSRLLKQAQPPLSSVYLQENLPYETRKQLMQMRRKAYVHRSEHPSDEAYVKNMKLYINGTVVEEISQNFQ